jgi:hypothetical protein
MKIILCFLMLRAAAASAQDRSALDQLRAAAETTGAVWADDAGRKPALETNIERAERLKIKPVSKSAISPKTGFSVGFMVPESLALAGYQLPYIGKGLGGFLHAVLLPAALLCGAIGFLIGRLF